MKRDGWQMAKVKVGLLFGGCSGEHEVSISSARAIGQALTAGDNGEKYQFLPVYIQKDGRWQEGDLAQQVLATGAIPTLEADDASTQRSIQPAPARLDRWQSSRQAAEVDVWLPILHGPNGEDGTVQGLLKLMQVPFVGSGVLGSALGMDKIAMKMIFAQAGIPQVKYLAVNRSQWSNPGFPNLCDQIEQAIGYPCFVKPANLGSSVGVAKVRTRAELEAGLDNAARYDRRLIVEAGVTAREVECAVLGNDQPKASVVGEICFASDFYDYETKYTQGLASLKIPAPLPEEITAQVQELSLRAFAAIDASGLARVDFFYIEATGEVLINEINTMPGFTATSMYPLLWDASGVAFPELVDQLVQLALERAGAA